MRSPMEGLKALSMAPKPSPMVAEEEESSGDDPRRAAVMPIAADLIAAVKSGDQAGVADALIAAAEACSEGGGETANESEEA